MRSVFPWLQRLPVLGVVLLAVACGESSTANNNFSLGDIDATVDSLTQFDAQTDDALAADGSDDVPSSGDTALADSTGLDSEGGDAQAADSGAEDSASSADTTPLGCSGRADGSPCEDGNLCTENDACKGGTCSGTAKVCDDKNPCTADSCDAAKGCVASNTSEACDDGDACTTADQCAEGKCAGKVNTCDDGNPCTDDTCDAKAGCSNTANTAACDDGNACTSGDTCAAGTCVGGATVACDDKNACTTDSCDVKSGCVNTAASDGAGCDDGDACTSGEVCKGGKCQGSAVDCDDKNPCTKDSCDAAKGCVSNADDTLSCDDGNSCTSGDACSAGVCKGVGKICDSDNNPCTDDGCKDNVCTYTPNTAPCDDGDLCSQKDACQAGKCAAGVAIACDDKNPCTTDSCDKATGLCKYAENNGSCDDGNVCTSGDSCTKAACVGKATSCDDGKPCTIDGCDQATGKCSNQAYANGTMCDDGSPCTQNDTCQDGNCGGVKIDCNDNNPCTTDSCQGAQGCSNVNNTAACDDGNPCSSGDACKDGKCIAGSAATACDDGNPCTTDVCDAVKGCVSSNNAANCDDGDACTEGDVCSSGACAGKAKNCDDGNLCTTDACDKAKGCAYVNNTALCTDGSVCTSDDTCKDGKCTGAPLPACNDANVCTTDVCDPKLGCQFKPVSAATKCDDGNPCTTGDACTALGKCVGIGAICDDNNPCTIDSCLNNKCDNSKFALAGAPCNDGSACTLGDACDGKGVCLAKSKVICNDFNGCTNDSCDAVKGCVYTANTVACDDGNFCTQNDTCKDGKCAVSTPKTCDDGNVCTNDACSSALNICLHVNNTAPCDDGNKCTPSDKCTKGLCVASAPINCDDANPCTLDSCDKATGVCKYALTTDVNVCKVFTVPTTWPVDFADPLWVNAGGSGSVKWATDANGAPGKLTGAASLNLNNGVSYADGSNTIQASGLGKFFVDATLFKGSQMSLSFYSWFDTETDNIHDLRYVDVSTDGFQTTAISQKLDSTAGAKAWRLEAINLNSLIGKKFQIRFRFDSVDGVLNNTAGWFVDQVNVYGGPIVTLTPGGGVNEPFDSNNNGWQFTAANASGTAWSIDNTAVVPPAAADAPIKSSLNFNNGKDFAGLSAGSALAPVLDLTGVTGGPITLLFKEYVDTEAFGGAVDSRYVEVTGDAFVTLPIKSVLPNNSAALYKGWRWATVDLSGVAGKKVHLRFRFDSADTANNGGLGWFVDDLRLDTVAAPSYAEAISCGNASVFTISNFNAVGWAIDNNAGQAFYSGDCSLNLSTKNAIGNFTFECPVNATKVGGTAKTAAFTVKGSTVAGAKTWLRFKAYFGGETVEGYDQLTVTIAEVGTKNTVSFVPDRTKFLTKWSEVAYDMTAFNGKNVVVTFGFDSGDCLDNAGAGIFIDDVMVRPDK